MKKKNATKQLTELGMVGAVVLEISKMYRESVWLALEPWQ